MNSSLSYEEKIQLITSSTLIPFFQLTIGFLGIGITTGAFFYTKMKTNINPFFKKMLLAMSVHQFLAFVCLSISSIVIFFAGYLNSMTCFVSFFSLYSLMAGSFVISTQTSKCRFECATAISEMKIPNLETMEKNVIKQMLAHYITSIVLSFPLSYDCSICVCQNDSRITLVFADMYWFAIMIIGIAYDVRMILFLKTRENIQPVTSNQIVPFFSGGNDELKNTIPKNSS